MSVFSYLVNQVVKTEIQSRFDNSETKFTLEGFGYDNPLKWFKKAKIVDTINYSRTFNYRKGKYEYTVEFKGFNETNNHIQGKFDYWYQKEQKKRDLEELSNEPVTSKFGKYYDKRRDELDCKNYKHTIYEYMTREDSCTYELFVQAIGYDNYNDFANNCKLDQEEIDAMYVDFCNGQIIDMTYSDGKNTEGMIY